MSITEDATMSRTRLEGGATVVREDAIVRVPARWPTVQTRDSDIIAGPAVSLFLNRYRVNKKHED